MQNGKILCRKHTAYIRYAESIKPTLFYIHIQRTFYYFFTFSRFWRFETFLNVLKIVFSDVFASMVKNDSKLG